MEIKINKEIRRYQENIFFGLSTRQFICSILALGMAVGVYFLLKGPLGEETVSWLCILAAVPVAAIGFFQYNSLTLEQFLLAWFKSEFLYAVPRKFAAENYYLLAIQDTEKAKAKEQGKKMAKTYGEELAKNEAAMAIPAAPASAKNPQKPQKKTHKKRKKELSAYEKIVGNRPVLPGPVDPGRAGPRRQR